MKLLPLYRNIITGDIAVITSDGFFVINTEDNFKFLFDNIRVCGDRESISKDFLNIYQDMVKLGVYNTNTSNVSINDPIIFTTNIYNAIKFSKIISLKRLCKEFVLCSKKKYIPLYALGKDIIDIIIKKLIGNYMIYSLFDFQIVGAPCIEEPLPEA